MFSCIAVTVVRVENTGYKSVDMKVGVVPGSGGGDCCFGGGGGVSTTPNTSMPESLPTVRSTLQLSSPRLVGTGTDPDTSWSHSAIGTIAMVIESWLLLPIDQLAVRLPVPGLLHQ